MSTKRVSAQMIIKTMASKMMALAAASGNCRYDACTWMILPTEAICCPPITPMVTKSPITMVMTKIEPMMMPVRHSGTITFHSVCQALAPASLAASIRLRSMRIMELKIGTIMNMVYRCTKASTTEKSENSSQSTGWFTTPRPIRPWLTKPLRPSSGTQDTMRMTLDVQKGIVHSTKSSVCMPLERTQKAKK